MQVTVYTDVLSHWCYVAHDAIEAIAAQLDPADFTLKFATVNRSKPMGYSNAEESWYYLRGAATYHRTLSAAWCENDQTGTHWPNAFAAAAMFAGGDGLAIARAAMSAALDKGELLGRREVALDVVALASGMSAEQLEQVALHHRVEARINEANDELDALGSEQRPTVVMTNNSSDRVVLTGVWRKEAILACFDALRADEAAYAKIGPPPTVFT